VDRLQALPGQAAVDRRDLTAGELIELADDVLQLPSASARAACDAVGRPSYPLTSP